MKKALSYLIVLCLFVFVGLWFLGQPNETTSITKFRETISEKNLITLSNGITNYRFDGPASGPLVLLIHGGREPLWTWNEVVPILNSAGFRTLRYDMFGRGLSDRPKDTTYNQAFYLHQIDDLLTALKIDEPLIVSGYSFGAAVAVKLANMRPHQVRSLILLAPRYYAIDLPAIINIPILNRALINKIVKPNALDEVRSFFRTEIQKRKYVHRVGTPEHIIGNLAAFRSFALSDALGSTKDIYRALAKNKVPVLVISGGSDVGITPSHIKAIAEEITRAKQIVHPEADHGLVWNHGNEIAKNIIDFVAPG